MLEFLFACRFPAILDNDNMSLLVSHTHPLTRSFPYVVSFSSGGKSHVSDCLLTIYNQTYPRTVLCTVPALLTFIIIKVT